MGSTKQSEGFFIQRTYLEQKIRMCVSGQRPVGSTEGEEQWVEPVSTFSIKGMAVIDRQKKPHVLRVHTVPEPWESLQLQKAKDMKNPSHCGAQVLSFYRDNNEIENDS